MSHLEKFLVAKSAEQSATDAAAAESAAIVQQQHQTALLRLRDQLSDIRAKYLDDLEDIEPAPSQHALCTYFIDRFAFAVGDESNSVADVVDCTEICTQHISLVANMVIDFEHMDSKFNRQHRVVTVDRLPFQSIQRFIIGKKPDECIFDCITAKTLRAYITHLAPGLTAELLQDAGNKTSNLNGPAAAGPALQRPASSDAPSRQATSTTALPQIHETAEWNDDILLSIPTRSRAKSERRTSIALRAEFERAAESAVIFRAFRQGRTSVKGAIHDVVRSLNRLADATFEVRDLGSFLKPVRSLRLTQSRVEIVKPDDDAKNNSNAALFHLYTEVVNVSILDLETFSVEFSSSDQPMTFSSPMVLHICAELNNRVAIHHALEKKRGALRALSSNSAEIQDYASSAASRDSSELGRVNSISETAPTPSIAKAVPRASKVEKLTGETDSERVHFTLERILLDSTTGEGRAKKTFLASLDKLVKQAESEINSNAADAQTDDTEPILERTRQFLDSIAEHFLTKRRTELGAILTAPASASSVMAAQFSGSEAVESVSVGIQLSEDEQASIRLRGIVEQKLQAVLLPPLLRQINSLLARRPKLRDDEKAVQDAMKKMRDFGQAEFHVPEHCRSRSDFALAVSELASMDRRQLPFEKMNILLCAANCIFEVHSLEHGNTATSIAGDDYLPIFSFVLCRACLMSPVQTCALLWGLSDAERLSGESGYYLTVFSAALEFIKNHSS